MFGTRRLKREIMEMAECLGNELLLGYYLSRARKSTAPFDGLYNRAMAASVGSGIRYTVTIDDVMKECPEFEETIGPFLPMLRDYDWKATLEQASFKS